MSRPVPLSFLLLLLIGLCGLCSWQWSRENDFRELTRRQHAEITSLHKELDETSARAKAADAEILRLTASLSELRTDSVPKTQYEETADAARKMRDSILKQNAALKEQQEALAKANQAIAQANQSIQSLAKERDGVVKKLNALTLEYNKLANPEKGAPQPPSSPNPAPNP
ncbi:MAG: hypothetical protein RLZZ399_286 [Verrucomicrobiota bacterium]|jgi:uncharacterized coiled-coil DUF342 family protein